MNAPVTLRNQSQRALDAVRDNPDLEIPDLAKIADCGKTLISYAHVVLERGTPEQIAAIDCGRTSLSSGYYRVRGVKKNDSKTKPPYEDIRVDARAQVLADLGAAITHILNLPKASDVAALARAKGRGKIANRFDVAMKWMEAFRDEWKQHSG